MLSSKHLGLKFFTSSFIIIGTLALSIVNGTNSWRTIQLRGEEPTYTITMDGSNAPTTSDTYASVEADIRNNHFEYSDVKASPGNHVELNTDGYIKNALDSQITSILSVTAVFSTAGSFSLETSYYGFDLFSPPVTLASTVAHDLSESLPYYLRLTANDDSVTITSITIIYSCSPHEAPLSAGGNYFLGSYPQTEVTDTTLVDTLNNAAGTLPSDENSQAWTSYNFYISSSNTTNFMWYKDIVNGADKYRGVYFTSYRPYLTSLSSSASNSYQDDNGYYIENTYWFKYEPIKWDVLSVDETGGPLVVSDMILDSRDYYHSTASRTIGGVTVYANNYKESNIRSWLNNDFYNQAFSGTEQSSINTTTVDNSVASTGYTTNQYACENTSDKMFLLSYLDVTNTNYGFSSNALRVRQATDYAKAMGVYVYTTTGSSIWWLRSPRIDYSFSARYVLNDGYILDSNVSLTYPGVLPAFRINQ
jgi:hypothetical protein